VYDDRLLFEFLMLEGAQAGLSWRTILKKREAYRHAFDHFDFARIAAYGEDKLAELLANPGMVRNRLKIAAAVKNAQEAVRLKDQFGSLSEPLWRFVGGKPKKNAWNSLSQVPTRTSESDAMARFLTQRGFKFVGSTICYAFMQAVGMVNDHVVDCFRHAELGGSGL